MSLFIWIIIFIVSLVVLIKAADIFTENSEKLGIALGVPAFIVGLTIVSIGTSLPELATSFVSVFRGTTEIVTANAMGSNIANVLLVIGISAVLARMLKVERDLINLDLPLLIASMILISFIVLDGRVVFTEAVILILAYIVYVAYTLKNKETLEDVVTKEEVAEVSNIKQRKRGKIKGVTIVSIIISAVFIYFGAELVIKSLINIAEVVGIGSAVIAMSALAIGTSLPELVVSATAVIKGKHEIGVGNIVGSNIFNTFMVIGLPGLFSTLSIDHNTLYIGLPFMIAATIIFAFSGISKKIYNWEGMFYLLIFVLFIGKLFGLF